MDKKVLKRLEGAVGTGELVNIVYHGGSQPGKARMVLPLKIKDDKLLARCYATNQVKYYFLDKIALQKSDTADYQVSRWGGRQAKADNPKAGIKQRLAGLSVNMAVVAAGTVAVMAFGAVKNFTKK